MKRAIIALGVVLVACGALAGLWLAAGRPELTPATISAAAADVGARLGLASKADQDSLAASGFIEADDATVASELGGRIVAIHADEGDTVAAGQALVELDDALLLAQMELSTADLATAEAALAKVKAGIRPETIAQAQAVLEQAEAAENAARVAWEDAEAMRDNPQQIELAVLAAQGKLGVLDFQTKQAEAIANAAQAGRDLADTAVDLLSDFEPYDEWVQVGTYNLSDLPPGIPLPPDLEDGTYTYHRYKVIVQHGMAEVWYLAPIRVPSDVLASARYEQATATYQSWQAWSGLGQAQAAREGAASYLDALAEQLASPLALSAKADAAESQYRVASAAVGVARAQVEGLKMGATPEQIAAAEAQVELARAALDALRSQATKFVIKSPLAGLVLDRPVHPGEMAVPGAPLLTVADLDSLRLTVYVPESDLGRIALGRQVSVTVDAYPGRVFTGTVTFIASEAEFTPKNVQTREERVNLVFAVKIRLPNLDRALKPGMPADAVLSTGDTRDERGAQ